MSHTTDDRKNKDFKYFQEDDQSERDRDNEAETLEKEKQSQLTQSTCDYMLWKQEKCTSFQGKTILVMEAKDSPCNKRVTILIGD